MASNSGQAPLLDIANLGYTISVALKEARINEPRRLRHPVEVNLGMFGARLQRVRVLAGRLGSNCRLRPIPARCVDPGNIHLR